MFTLCTIIIILLQLIHTIAFECGDDSLVKYDRHGLPKKIPWAVYIKLNTIQCTGVIVSPSEIVAWNCPFENAHKKVDLFFHRRRIVREVTDVAVSLRRKTIRDANWSRLGKYSILTLEKPLKISKKSAPICITRSSKEKMVKKFYFQYEDKFIYGRRKRNPREVLAIITKLKFHERENGVSAITYKEDGKWFLEAFNSSPEARMQTSLLAYLIK